MIILEEEDALNIAWLAKEFLLEHNDLEMITTPYPYKTYYHTKKVSLHKLLKMLTLPTDNRRLEYDKT